MTEYFEPLVQQADGLFILIINELDYPLNLPLIGFDSGESMCAFISKWIASYEAETGRRFYRYGVPDVFIKAFETTTLKDYDTGTWFEDHYH